MRKLIYILSILLCVFMVRAQSADGRYSSRMTQDGVIYFIMPHKLTDLSGIKKFEYDVTLLNWTDSATVNFTFESNSMLVPERLAIKVGNDDISCYSYSPLFIDIKKGHYEVRITSKFSIGEIEKILNSTTPPIFTFAQGGNPESATYTKKAWAKDRKKLNDIFKLYLYSK